MPNEYRVVVKGIGSTLTALRQLDPDVDAEVQATLTWAAGLLKSAAEPLISQEGLSGWKKYRGGYSAGSISSGLKRSKAKRRKTGMFVSNAVGVQNTNAAGAIWEVAGRRTDGNPPRAGKNPRGGSFGNGQALIQGMRDKSGGASRILWAAYDGGVAEQTATALIAAAEKAKATCRTRLAAMN